MKKISKFSTNCKLFTFLIFIFLSPLALYSQTNKILIKRIQEEMLENYIFLDKAKEVNAHLDNLVKENYFNSYDNPDELARVLSKELQKITKDKHLNVTPPRNRNSQRNTQNFITNHLQNLERFRQKGFKEINLFDGNVGYVKLNGFRQEDISKVDHIMEYLSTADAIIIDLRENGGGSALGEYWSSYFFKNGMVLNRSYCRKTDTTEEFKIIPVKGQKRLDVPLFVLTSSFTFSAAESFAYDLQSRNRAIIIGEITGGGAHAVNFKRLNAGFGLIVPYKESINPVTNTNWEGIGVIPNIKTTKNTALDKAKILAKAAAKKYRHSTFEELEKILKVENPNSKVENTVYQLLQKILQRKHLESFMVNDLGYNYLRNKNYSAALSVFKANIKLVPESPNTYDSYAEALLLTGYKQEAIKYYQKAVIIAESQNNKQLKFYKENLKKAKLKN